MAGRGAPLGNTNGAKSKRWAEALDKAVKQFADKKLKIEMGQALDRIARNVVKEALLGDWWAVAELGNRLDGKAAQSLDISGSIEHKHINELTDDELCDIATGSSPRAAEETPGAKVIN